jgi:hypothetical protein
MSLYEPAYPNGSRTYAGLTIRDYFAGQALSGILARNSASAGEAEWLAYKSADRMIARREKEGKLRDHEIEGLTRRAETAERSLEITQAWSHRAETALKEIAEWPSDIPGSLRKLANQGRGHD